MMTSFFLVVVVVVVVILPSQLSWCSASAFVFQQQQQSPFSVVTTYYDRRVSHLRPLATTKADTSSSNLDYDDDNDPDVQQQQQRTHIVFPGGGIFFYHQAGIVTYMRQQGYDFSRCTMTGASAGALTASLTANNVDFYEATELALQMATDAKVWDRPGGLLGIWGDMNRRWLDTLLPKSSEEVLRNVQGRVTLLVTPFPTVQKKSKISTFNDRHDFIQCNLASIHLVRTGP
jgi:predicted acylesterase/phospholipase RssA